MNDPDGWINEIDNIVESLFVTQGRDQGCRFELLNDVVTLGRDPNNQIQLHDGEISRKHAEIRLSDHVRLLIDSNSSNGIFVNGQRVARQPLLNGDQIRLGRTVLIYTIGVENEASYQEGTPVDFQQKQEKSRIIHSLSQEEGRRFFQTSAPKERESAWLSKAKAHLNLMYHTTLVVSQTLDIDRLLQRIMDLIFEWVQVDHGCILLYDPEDNSLVPKVSRTRNSEVFSSRLSISQTILDYVLKRQEGVLTSDAQTDQRWEPAASIVHMGIREAICVPMQGRYGLVGVIYIDTTRSPYDLAESEKPPVTQGTEAEPLSTKAAEKEQENQKNLAATTSLDRRSERENEASGPIPSEPLTLSYKLKLDQNAFQEKRLLKENETPKASASPMASLGASLGAGSSEQFSQSGFLQGKSKQLTADHLKLMVAIGHQAALAVEDTQYYLGMVQAERLAAVGQTVAVLSHHIKNILQGIRGGSYLIDLGLKEHDEVLVRKGWGIVEKNQTKISDLVLDMLTFSKERTPVLELADINRVVEDVVELMQGRGRELGVQLKGVSFEKIPKFLFDAEQIHRALTNLVTNAIDAARERVEELSETCLENQTEHLKQTESLKKNGSNADNFDADSASSSFRSDFEGSKFDAEEPKTDKEEKKTDLKWMSSSNFADSPKTETLKLEPQAVEKPQADSSKIGSQNAEKREGGLFKKGGLAGGTATRPLTGKSGSSDASVASFEALSPIEEEPNVQILSKKPRNADQGRVEIRTVFLERSSTVVLYVDDNGPGVAPEIKDDLFRSFLSKNKSGGTGLGLAVTHKIIQEHQGRVDVTDSPLGGARFVVELPFVQETPDEKNDVS